MDILPDSTNGITELHMQIRHWETMKKHVVSCIPEEACGFLAGDGEFVREVIPVTNALHSPYRFRMAPDEQLAAMMVMEEKGYEIVGIFHSHIHGPTDLSETDLKEWTYPEVVLLVWSRMEGDWQCRAFRLLGERPYEIPVVVQNE